MKTVQNELDILTKPKKADKMSSTKARTIGKRDREIRRQWKENEPQTSK